MSSINPSIKHHAIIGFLLSLWGLLFTMFARPFEHGHMDFQKWVFVGIGFNALVFLSYLFVSWIQHVVFQKLAKWNLYLEVGVYVIFYLIYTLSTYIYYKSSWIEGIYNFSEFFVNIILNIILIVSPILFLARRYVLKLVDREDNDELVIKGENKLDFLKIYKSDLICISKSQNYVEIFYLEKEELQTKLLRSSLKKIQQEFDFLVQVHRSHLINPSHFKSWKDGNTISLTHMELPVSKNYKKQLLSL
ncbi:MAG: LytTR family DNA-binding domain-containing protein [Bacteroidota bacterium]